MGADTALDIESITHLDDEWDIACEISNHPHAGTGPAEWIMWFSCCGKSRFGNCILACTGCKDYKLSCEVITCNASNGGCGQVFVPGSTAYRLIEPLSKR